MDKDFAIFFFFEKPKNICTFQKFTFKEVLENIKKYFFPPLGAMCGSRSNYFSCLNNVVLLLDPWI